MIQDKINEMQEIQSGFGNYGFGLGQLIRQKEGISNRTQEPEAVSPVKQEEEKKVLPNLITTKNGLMDEEGLRRASGWKEPFKSETLLSTLRCLEDFHREMDTVVDAKTMAHPGTKKDLVEVYENLLDKVEHYIQRGSQWYSGIHLHRKEEKAMLPVMSTFLIKLYSMGNVFDNINNLGLDYMVENGKTSASFSEVLTSKMAGNIQGTMSSVTEQTGQVDKTAYQMKKRNSQEEKFSADDEIKARRLPSLNEKNSREELRRIAVMIEEAELRVETNIGREQYKIEYGDLLKMIYILLNQAEEEEEKKITWKQEDVVQARDFWNKTAGMTVEDAVMEINKIREESYETASVKSVKSGGNLSGVLIDKENKRVLRTSDNQKDLKTKRDNNNYNYDEAMSRLAEVTGLKSMAGARTTYYKDMEGKLQYGTNMELAAGKDASEAKLSFGDQETDRRMRSGRHNIFGSSSKKELNRNADIIVSSYNMQILDYIACHQDRHVNNIFIDLDAKDGTQAFTGIDNDNVFGKSLGTLKSTRKIENAAHVTGAYEEAAKGKYQDVTTLLEGFEFIPQETAAQVKRLSPTKINEALKPYLDRSARFAVINRVNKLKEYVGNKSRVMNIRTEEGMDAFKKETINRMLGVALEVSNAEVSEENRQFLMGVATQMGSNGRKMTGILMRTLMCQYFTMTNKLVTKKDGSYHYMQEFEYTPEGTEEDYITKSNIGKREENFNKTFDSMLRVINKTREGLWNETMERKYGAEEVKKMELNAEYRVAKESFIRGKMKFFDTYQVK